MFLNSVGLDRCNINMLPKIVFTISESFSMSTSRNRREARHEILQDRLQSAKRSMATTCQWTYSGYLHSKTSQQEDVSRAVVISVCAQRYPASSKKARKHKVAKYGLRDYWGSCVHLPYVVGYPGCDSHDCVHLEVAVGTCICICNSAVKRE